MADAWHHAVSSARKWGGEPAEYMHLHVFFDQSKTSFGDFRHRAVYHHTEGIAELIARFGPVLVTSEGREVPTRWVGEQHLLEDFGFLPTRAMWLNAIQPAAWMQAGARRLSKELEAAS